MAGLQGSAVMEKIMALLAVLMGDVRAETSYSVFPADTRVVIVDAEDHRALYAALNGMPMERVQGLAAFFSSGTIYLPDTFDPDDPLSQSELLHEAVHAAQMASDAAPDAYSAEQEAYAVQARWLEARGLAEEASVVRLFGLLKGIDPKSVAYGMESSP
jgi:hypothetical protein